MANRGETVSNHLRMKSLHRGKLLNADVCEVEGHLCV